LVPAVEDIGQITTPLRPGLARLWQIEVDIVVGVEEKEAVQVPGIERHHEVAGGGTDLGLVGRVRRFPGRENGRGENHPEE
jgi:hypothetical protein